MVYFGRFMARSQKGDLMVQDECLVRKDRNSLKTKEYYGPLLRSLNPFSDRLHQVVRKNDFSVFIGLMPDDLIIRQPGKV